jgi:2-oxoglutarate ferredoxin oxidoreductase subunit gamma
MTLTKVVFSGFGGQGIMMMGYALANAVMKDGHEITLLPAYGAEVRGGSANCTIAISDDEIASPVASAPEFIVVMSTPAFLRFQNHIKSGGTLILNSSLIEGETIREDIKVIPVPAGKWALELGDLRVANFVMLGAFARLTGLVTLKSLEESLVSLFPARKAKLLELNQRALRFGYQTIEKEEK